MVGLPTPQIPTKLKELGEKPLHGKGGARHKLTYCAAADDLAQLVFAIFLFAKLARATHKQFSVHTKL